MLNMSKRLGMGTSLSKYLGADILGDGPLASFWGDGPAPEGFRWEYVFDDLNRPVRAAGGTINPADEPVVALVEI